MTADEHRLLLARRKDERDVDRGWRRPAEPPRPPRSVPDDAFELSLAVAVLTWLAVCEYYSPEDRGEL
jgi:hypothetical protein